MSDQISVIDEFPRDGKNWCIRWVDEYILPHRKTATCSVNVSLSSYQTDASRTPDIKDFCIHSDTEVNLNVRLLAGHIPALKIGSIFNNQTYIGDISSHFITFNFNLNEYPPEILRADQTLSPAPSWWTIGEEKYRVINISEYKLDSNLKSYCVVLRNPQQTLILPCHEVFRALYAPHTDLALALTSKPWGFSYSKIVDPDHTGINRETGEWQVALRRNIDNAFLPTVTNLTVNKDGIRHAKSIHTNLLDKNNYNRIKANIPFRSDTVRVRVRVAKLHSNFDKYLGLEITGISWPLPDITSVKYTRNNDASKGEILIETERPKPYGKKPRKVKEHEDGEVETTSAEDPSEYSGNVIFKSAGLEWFQPPHFTLIPKMLSYIYRGSHHDEGKPPFDKASSGNPFYGESDSGKAKFSYVERRDASHRFQELIAALNKLRQTGLIGSWGIEGPKNPVYYRGELCVWPFPTTYKNQYSNIVRNHWSYLISSDNHRRTCLACVIKFKGKTVYWLEIECRSTENGYTYLLFTCNGQYSKHIIKSLLQLCSDDKGKWPTINDAKKLGILSARACKHVYSKAPDEKENTQCELNTNTIIRNLTSILFPPESSTSVSSSK